jgi:hypothetical protein
LRPAKFNVALGGSAFCIVADRYLLTAHHVLNNGHAREPNDKFYAFVVPGNGNVAHHFPIVSFPLERPDIDVAVLEIGPCATAGVHFPALPLSFGQLVDGTRVVTVGFPAPEIVGVGLDREGNYLGGQLFLMSHANEGIVSAHYSLGTVPVYELNVGWHHGESGGPIVCLDDPVAAFSLMQHYRNIKAPHGTMAGPHRGCALSSLQPDLVALGAAIV